MKLRNIPFRLETSIVHACYRAAGLRPSSAPYLSGDGFRFLCRRKYEGNGRQTFEPLSVQEDEIVYCEAWHLVEFLRDVAVRVPRRFSVVSHNGDPNIDESILSLLPPNLHRLFAQNAIARDDRLTPLPIGLENKHLHCNGVTRDFDILRSREPRKIPRILVSFSADNNPRIREKAKNDLNGSRLCDAVSRLNSRAYRELAAGYMFIASPPGNGVDCHRTWEAMYLGVVPIVLRSSLMESFCARGLPLCVVDSYEQVREWDEGTLISQFESRVRQMDGEALWLDYWSKIINPEQGKTWRS